MLLGGGTLRRMAAGRARHGVLYEWRHAPGRLPTSGLHAMDKLLPAAYWSLGEA